MYKHFPFITIIAIAFGIFTAMSFVSAQQFTEPTPTISLPAPVTTSKAPQAIVGPLAIGTTLQNAAPVFATTTAKLYVSGSMVTRINNAAQPPRQAKVQAGCQNAGCATGDITFQIQGGHALFGYTLDECAAGQVCVKAKTSPNSVALHVVNPTGTAIYGLTTANGFAGVKGQGYYGVEAFASQSDPLMGMIALYGVSCVEITPGTCAENSYGDAGYFDGNIKIEELAANAPSGMFTGEGRNIYKIHSLFNKAQPADSMLAGLRYKSFGISPTIAVNNGVPKTINLGVSNVVSIIAVENQGVTLPDSTTYRPLGKDVTMSLDEASPVNITLTNNSGPGQARLVQFVVVYLAN